mmetsp:Transcript_16328/g.45158  ORF Transcript_16328/g.45158 Transcript_16328/m.45158 type:complete len:96 (-) Transcript_16328:20-307(-)
MRSATQRNYRRQLSFRSAFNTANANANTNANPSAHCETISEAKTESSRGEQSFPGIALCCNGIQSNHSNEDNDIMILCRILVTLKTIEYSAFGTL